VLSPVRGVSSTLGEITSKGMRRRSNNSRRYTDVDAKMSDGFCRVTVEMLIAACTFKLALI
jgi:hypothetical protein